MTDIYHFSLTDMKIYFKVRFHFAPRSWLPAEELFPGSCLQVLNVIITRCIGKFVILNINYSSSKCHFIHLLVHRQAQNLTFPLSNYL